MIKKEVEIYTDGACTGNPGAGGYCAILIYKGTEKIVSGSEENTTNNRMELLSAIMGLKALKESCKVKIYSDSQYLVDAFNKGWIYDWQMKSWRTASKSEVKNVDLWEAILEQIKKHEVEFIKVKGHADNEYNNRCDKIAREEYKKYIN